MVKPIEQLGLHVLPGRPAGLWVVAMPQVLCQAGVAESAAADGCLARPDWENSGPGRADGEPGARA